VLAEYREMPGLCLTAQQACRLWQIDPATCTRILEGLVEERFLRRTPAGAFIAAALGRPERSIRPEMTT
jgi:DNA-binding IclR family transcriptional regulator